MQYNSDFNLDSGVFKAINHTLYDTICINKFAPFKRIDFFQHAANQDNVSYLDTNLQIPAQLPEQCHFLITEYDFETNAFIFMENTFADFVIGCQSYYTMLTTDFNKMEINDRLRLLIPPKQYFQMTVKCDEEVTLNFDLEITCKLKGIMYRPSV